MSGTLVIQPLPGIGDMVWHLPHIHAIAQASPGGQVTVLTKARSRAEQLLAADPHVRQVLWLQRERRGHHAGLSGLLRLARQLRACRFDTVWILHDSARYAFAAWLAGIPRRIGYTTGAARVLFTQPLRLTSDQQAWHPIDKADLLLRVQGLNVPSARLSIAADAAVRVQQRFGSNAKPWVALGIGTSEPYKQWGAPRFAELACALARRYGMTAFLIGGDGERTLGDEIAASAQSRGVKIENALGLSVADTMALLAECRIYVGNDTGFLNVAAAVGVPAFGLFGASPPLTHTDMIHCLLPEDGSLPDYGTPYMERISVPGVLTALSGVLER